MDVCLQKLYYDKHVTHKSLGFDPASIVHCVLDPNIVFGVEGNVFFDSPDKVPSGQSHVLPCLLIGISTLHNERIQIYDCLVPLVQWIRDQ
jgi:hypothetical protein